MGLDRRHQRDCTPKLTEGEELELFVLRKYFGLSASEVEHETEAWELDMLLRILSKVEGWGKSDEPPELPDDLDPRVKELLS